jgi:hypothetical protein
MAQEMANVLKERRIKIAASYLDRAALHRAESGDRIPSLAFWVDWADTLGVPLEKVIAEAKLWTPTNSLTTPLNLELRQILKMN